MFCRARVARTCTVPKRRRLRYRILAFRVRLRPLASVVSDAASVGSNLPCPSRLFLPLSSRCSARGGAVATRRRRRLSPLPRRRRRPPPPPPAADFSFPRKPPPAPPLATFAPGTIAAPEAVATLGGDISARSLPWNPPLLSSPSQRRPRLAHRELLLLAPVADAAAADAAAAAAAARGEARAPSQVAVYRADAAREGRQVAAALRARQRRDPARRPFPGAVVQAVVPSQRRDRGGHRRRARAAPSARARGRVVHADDRPRAGRARTRRDADAD